MSLSGIFDPMVRAYFKNNGGGGGSRELKFVESVPEYNTEYNEDMEMWHISKLTPTVDELTGGVYAGFHGEYMMAKTFTVEPAEEDGILAGAYIVFGDVVLAMVLYPVYAEILGDASLAGIWTLQNDYPFALVW